MQVKFGTDKIAIPLWSCVFTFNVRRVERRVFPYIRCDNLSSLYTSSFVFPKALFSILYSSLCTLILSILSSPFPWMTTFMQVTLNFSFYFTHPTLTQASLTFRTPFNRCLPGWLKIFEPLTPLRLNSFSTDSKRTCQNIKLTKHSLLCSQPWLYLWWTPHIFRLDLISLQIVLLSYSLTSLYPPLPRFQNSLYHCHFHRSLQTWLQ